MASTYSPNLRLELIGTGEQQGTWGTTTNTNLGTLLEEAIGGYASVTVSNLGDTTLTTNNGSADESRNMVINLTGTITAARNVLCPAIEKLYVVKNATTGGYAVTFKVSGQTGVTIPNGETYFLYVNGIDVQKIVGNTASTNTTNTFTANQIISVTDNTNAALRITQLGNGDALLVEDSSNPDSSPFVVKASGYVGIGLTDPSEALEVNGNVLMETSGSGGNSPILTIKNTSGATPDSFGPSVLFDNSVANTHGFAVGQFQSAESYFFVGNSESPYDKYMLINQDGNVNIGLQDDPGTVLQITGLMSATAYAVGSISGTTLTITSTGEWPISVGDRLFGSSTIDYNTYVVSQVSGTTGGVGTYTISNSMTLASTTIYFVPSRYNTIGFVDTNTATGGNVPFGGIEWYSSDASSPGAGVKAYVAALSESASPDSALTFGTADAAQAVERMRINSSGYVGIGKKAPETPLDVAGQIRATEGGVDGRFLPLNSGNGLLIGAVSSSDVVFVSNNSERIRITAAGLVGVGTSSPSVALDVAGAIRTSTTVPEVIYNETDTGTVIRTLVDGGRWDVRRNDYTSLFGVDNATGDTILCPSVGNVGIGALASATNRLYVNGSAQASTFEVGNASDTTISRAAAGVIAVEGGVVPKENRTNNFTAQQTISLSGAGPIGLTIAASSDPTSDRAAIQTGAWLFGQDVGATGPDDFFIYDANASALRFYIATDGKVGIGTASPTCLLDVDGGIKTNKTDLSAGSGNAAGQATNGNVYSGVYTPTLFGITNVAASNAYQSVFMRVGNVVTVAGRVEIDPTATGTTVLEMNVPYASNLTAASLCSGTFSNGGSASGTYGAITANTSSDRAVFTIDAGSTAARIYSFSFTYLVG